MGIKILLVDDQKIVRDILRAVIENQPGMKVVAEAQDGRAALMQTRRFRPDVIVMDIVMPELNGIDATRRIMAEFPGTKVIALSMHSDRQFVDGMLEAGASGYLLKDRALEELVQAICTVVDNRMHMCPDVTGVAVNE